MRIDLRQADCLHELRNIPASSLDLVVADPPYNLGKDYGNNHDLRGHAEYLKFTLDWLTEIRRVLKPDGSIYVFMGVRFVSYLYDILDQKLGFFFNSWITWHYTQGMGKTKGFSPRHEDILFFTKSEKFNFYLDAIRIPQKYFRARNNMNGANPGDVWQFSHVHYSNPEREEHPTQKPEALIARVIMASSKTEDIVLDPFSGSGTTLRVCQQLNRNCIGIELNPDYVEMTKKRLMVPFNGFDSLDVRAQRIPKDMNQKVVYIEQEELFTSQQKMVL
jgi:site-specific DNA-methyltransferase (adenine-specific)